MRDQLPDSCLSNGNGEALAGREQELARIDHALSAAANGSQPRIVLSGEPGIGKSVLLQQIGVRARAIGLRVEVGVADEHGTEAPLSLFVDALDSAFAELEPDDLAALGQGRTAELARVFPALSHHAGEPSTVEQATPRIAFAAALTAALERLAAHSPLVLALDDVQWADDASLSLIARLLRRPPRGVVPVLAHRTGAVPRLLLRAVGVTGAADDLVHVELGPLAPEAALQLLDGIPTARAQAILHESGRNPFYLSQLARRERDGGSFATLSAALVGELSALSPVAQELVRAAAVLGEQFDPQMAVEVAQLPEREADDALPELVLAGLIRMSDRPEICTFRHPFVVEIVSEWAGRAWCSSGHTRAAATLAAAGAPAVQRARHVEHVARPGDLESAALLAEAGDELLVRDPRAAARLFRAALRLIGPDDPDRRLPLLLQLAFALGAAGRWSVGKPLEEVHELLPVVSEAVRADALAALAGSETLLVHCPDGRRMLSKLNDAGGRIQPLTLTVTHFYAGAYDSMADAAREALAHVPASRPWLRADPAALLSIALAQLGDPGAAVAALRDAERAAEDTTSPVTIAYLAAASEEVDLSLSSVSYCDLLLEVSRLHGMDSLVVPALAGRAAGEVRLGDLTAADRSTREALEEAGERDDPFTAMVAHGHRCLVTTALGELDEALAHGEAAVAALADVPVALNRDQPVGFLATAKLAAGDPSGAIDALLAAGGSVDLHAIAPTWRAHWAGVLAEAELARRNIEQARDWSRRAAASAAAVGTASALANANRTSALVLLAQGDAHGAQQAAEHAVHGFEAIGRPLDAAGARVSLGLAIGLASEREAGVAQVRAAHDTLAAAGAVLQRDAAARALRRLGQRTRSGRRRTRRPASGVAALSRREREIAALVATGATNRQIAADLVISEKTVESHMSRVLAKLGVASRTAAAHVLAGEA